jgi:hypothetical protein
MTKYTIGMPQVLGLLFRDWSRTKWQNSALVLKPSYAGSDARVLWQALLIRSNVSVAEAFRMLSRARGVMVADTEQQAEWVREYARSAI